LSGFLAHGKGGMIRPLRHREARSALAIQTSGLLRSARDDERGARDDEKIGIRRTRGDIRLGFVYERVPHITLKSTANNVEIDVIRDRYQAEFLCRRPWPCREGLLSHLARAQREMARLAVSLFRGNRGGRDKNDLHSH
jgi:hypothetical protein